MTDLKKALRVLAYLGVVGGIGAVLVRRPSAANAQEFVAAQGISDDMMTLRPLLGPDPRRLKLNGEALWVAHATTRLSVHEVLDRFQALCTSKGAAPWTFGEAEKRPIEEFQKALVDAKGMQLGAMREETEAGGVVLCFVPTGEQTFLDRVLRFQSESDLAAFGKMRLVRATATDGYVNVVSSWTEGAFRKDHVFAEPKAGEDAPGDDSAKVARPSGSHRLMSSTIDGAPYAARAYEKAGTPKDVLIAYEVELREAQWDRAPILHEGESDVRRIYKRGGDIIVVSVHEASAGRTRVLVSEIGSDPTVWRAGDLKPAP